MCIPAFLLVAFTLGIPIIQAFYYSMTKWNGITTTWIGPSAYWDELTNPIFWRVIENNALLLLSVPVALLIALAIASILNERVWGWRVFRTIYFLPTAVSWVVIGMVAASFFAKGGMLNSMISAIGLSQLQTDFLSGEHTALLAIGVTFVWSTIGTNTIIFLTGMATLDESTLEAARVDGAGFARVFWHITLPQLKRFIQFALVITVISAFTALFSLIFVMTGGGPGYGTTTLEFYVYQTAFAKGAFGTGALLGVILFFIMAIIGLAQLKLLRTKD